MRILICMPTGENFIQDNTVIRDALVTVVNRINEQRLKLEIPGAFCSGEKEV